MLNPSYTELMEVINEQQTIDNKITSRYAIVIAVAKRARQLIDGDEPNVQAKSDKPVSIAVEEMSKNKVKISMHSDGDIAILDEMYSTMGEEGKSLSD